MQGPVQRVHLALARTPGTGATLPSQGHHLVVSAARTRPPGDQLWFRTWSLSQLHCSGVLLSPLLLWEPQSY